MVQVTGLEFNGLPSGRQGFLPCIRAHRVESGERSVGWRELRIQADGLFEIGHDCRAIFGVYTPFPHLGARRKKISQKTGGVELHGARKFFLGVAQVSLVIGEHAQALMGEGKIGVGLHGGI